MSTQYNCCIFRYLCLQGASTPSVFMPQCSTWLQDVFSLKYFWWHAFESHLTVTHRSSRHFQYASIHPHAYSLVAAQTLAAGSVPVCVHKPVSHSMCSSNRAHLLGRISISEAAIEADSSLCPCMSVCASVPVWAYFPIGSDGSPFHVSLLISLELLTVRRGDKLPVTWVWRFHTVCLSVFHILCTCTSPCELIREFYRWAEAVSFFFFF